MPTERSLVSGDILKEGVVFPGAEERAALGLALVLIGPSLGHVQKYTGTWGVLLYVLGVVAFWAWVPRLLRRVDARVVPERWAWGLALGTGIALLLLFFALYPLADSGIVGGGSDRDDALNLGAREILRGRCPYHVTTYLGNPLSPLPGGMLLALPFVVLGNSAYQNFFWLGVFFLLAQRLLRDVRQTLLLLWSLLVFSPVLLQQIVTGGDLPAQSIAVLTFLWLLLRAPRRWKPAAAFLLGLGVAWRANVLFLAPLIFAFLRQQVGGRAALGLMGIAGGVAASVTLPFALHAPHGFAPFLMQNKLARFEAIVPHADLLIAVVTFGWAWALARSRVGADAGALLQCSAHVLALPILCGLILASLQAGELDLHLAEYGVSFLFFGALANWLLLVRALTVSGRMSLG